MFSHKLSSLCKGMEQTLPLNEPPSFCSLLQVLFLKYCEYFPFIFGVFHDVQHWLGVCLFHRWKTWNSQKSTFWTFFDCTHHNVALCIQNVVLTWGAASFSAAGSVQFVPYNSWSCQGSGEVVSNFQAVEPYFFVSQWKGAAMHQNPGTLLKCRRFPAWKQQQ